ncbi:MAG: RluA family pseudouridine synthase [Calditrichia bacterium]
MPKTIVLEIPKLDLPTRLDLLIAGYSQFSRRQAKELISQGSVFISNRRIRRASRLYSGPLNIKIFLGNQDSIEKEAQQIHWPDLILYQDSDLLAMNKPAGIPTAPTPNSAVHNVYEYLKRNSIIPSTYYPFHRLDKGTSGILLIPLTRRMAHSLNEQMQKRNIIKIYSAICLGHLTSKNIIIKGYISRQRPHSPRFQFFKEETAGSRYSETIIKVLREARLPLSLVEAQPKTGRTHQIRLHLASLNHPVLGDPLYGPRSIPDFLPANSLSQRMFLHCREMSFFHPFIRDQITISATLPEHFLQILRELFPDSPE